MTVAHDDPSRINRAFYRDAAGEFDATRQRPWAGWERLIPHLAPALESTDARLLDVGCGNGRFARFLVARGLACRWVGVDASFELLARATGTRIAGDALALPLRPDARFAAIVVFGLLHHLEGDRPRSLLAECGARLARGGVLAVTFWDFAAAPGEHVLPFGASRTPRFCRTFSPAEKDAAIEATGLECIDRFAADRANDYVVMRHRGGRG